MMTQHTLDHSHEPLRVAPWRPIAQAQAIPGRGAQNIYPNHLVRPYPAPGEELPKKYFYRTSQSKALGLEVMGLYTLIVVVA